MLRNFLCYDLESDGGGGFDVATVIGDGGSLNADGIRASLGEGYEDFKGFDDYKDLPALLKGTADTKQAYSKKQEGMIKLPTAESTPEEVTAYRTAKGVPESADKYELTRRELPEGASFDEAGTQMIKGWMHEKGYNQSEAQDLMTMYDQYEESLITRMAEQQVADAKEATDAFTAKHGNEVEKVTRLAGEAMQKTGFTEKVLTHLEAKYPGIGNDPKILDWFHSDIIPKMLGGEFHDHGNPGDGDPAKKGLENIYNHKTSEQLKPAV